MNTLWNILKEKSEGVAGFLIFSALAIIICTSGCSKSSDTSMLVAVSILPQQEFVEQVAGQNPPEIMVLIPPGANPATYELSPSQMQKIDRAVAYFKVGSGLPFEEIWLDKISKLNPKMKIIDCSKNIEIMSGAADAHATEGAHGQDPHIWLSPRNAKIMVSNIAKGMAEVDSGNAATYEKNASAYQTKLDQLDITIRNEFEGITNRNFLIYHPAWGYFARDYDLNQIPIEIEGKEPRAADLTALVKLAKEKNLQTVFASPEFNTESARTIAKEIGGKVELIDPLAKDYVSNLTSVAIKLAQSMK